MDSSQEPAVASFFRHRYVTENSLEKIPIIEHGECLYRTVSFFVFNGDQSQFITVRQDIVKKVERNPFIYTDFFAENNDNEEPSLQALI